MDLPLEDEFGDILRKAMIGTHFDARSLAAATGIDERHIAGWARSGGAASQEQARALATPLHLDPARFADSAAARWYPQAVEAPEVRRHAQRPHPSNGYIFSLEDANRAALVDPAGLPENVLRAVADGAYDVQYILITHKHADHCDATAQVAAAFPHATIVMHELDVHAIGALAPKALLVGDGGELPLRNGASIGMLHTPGHTDGSACYRFKSTVFTGDTLFAGSVGGAYGDASTYDDILESIRSKLFTLTPETVVMPGHGPPTTIAQELAHNPFFPPPLPSR